MNLTMRTLALPVVTVATALALASCGGSSAGNPGQDMPGMNSASRPATTSASVGPAAAGPHNPADVTFAAGMIPHHRQAVTMAQMALTTATNPGIKDLATAIKAAQDPEIETMSGWLTGWGQPVPAPTQDMSQMGSSTSGTMGDGTVGGSDMGSIGGMGGMMSDQQMSQLSGTSGAAFDKLWLQLMTAHHQGAVAMARTELTDGANTEAKQLAQSIIDSQSKEITTMTTLLATLGS
ncbi:DUF305 domain-containing protein [Dermatophilaceae bacterium Soc4.6]